MNYTLLRITLLCFLFPLIVCAQETTGRLEGKINDSKNQPIAFANIIITDTETNFKYGSISQESGFYSVNNLPPGSNYKIEVTFLGYRTEILENITINLGATTTKDFTLKEEDEALNAVILNVDRRNLKKDNEQLISKKIITQTPTISRSIQDLTRTLPEANLNSFAGASNRFNNLNIDGVANNDVVGFQEPASGAAGSSANGTSGSPFSFVNQGDVNRDGSSRNDLVYVPNDQSEINLIDITDSKGTVITTAAEQWENLNNYINTNDYLRSRRGQYTERNGAKTPWNHRLDARFEYGLNLKGTHRISLLLDVFNVLNLVNRNWGKLVFVPNVVNSSFSLLNFQGIENNQPTYQFNIEDATPWVVDTESSRWKAQFGATYQF